MEFDHVAAGGVFIIIALLAFLFLTSSKSKDGPQSAQAVRIPTRKSQFTLPVPKPDIQHGYEDAAAARLGLTRDSGCIVTISFDIQQKQSFENGSQTISVLSNTANIFFVMKAESDEDESRVYEILSKLSLDNPIARHRFLFYQSSIGKLAIMRQLKPQLHIDFDSFICKQLVPHIRQVLHLKGNEKIELSQSSNSTNSIKPLQFIRRIEELLHLTL